MTSSMLTCQELIEFLAAYVDGELPAEQCAHFDAHLFLCPQCVDYLHGYRESIRLGKSACADVDDVPEELVDAILAARKG